MILRTSIAALGATLLVPALAIAEPPPARDPSGASLGCGYLVCRADLDDTTLGGTTNWSGSVAYRGPAGPSRLPVSVAAQGWGMTHQDQTVAISQGIVTLGVRAWVAPEAWVQAGFGAARRQLSSHAGAPARIESAPATTTGMGAELISEPDFVLALAVHAGAGLDDDHRLLVYNISIGVGGSFF